MSEYYARYDYNVLATSHWVIYERKRFFFMNVDQEVERFRTSSGSVGAFADYEKMIKPELRRLEEETIIKVCIND